MNGTAKPESAEAVVFWTQAGDIIWGNTLISKDDLRVGKCDLRSRYAAGSGEIVSAPAIPRSPGNTRNFVGIGRIGRPTPGRQGFTGKSPGEVEQGIRAATFSEATPLASDATLLASPI